MNTFDWLKEQIRESAVMRSNSKKFYEDPQDGQYVDEVVLVKDMDAIITEAEAKWESDRNTFIELLQGKWVDSDRVKSSLGMSFSECWDMFEFSRTAEWWSIVGETEEERTRNGQKITIRFRVKVAEVK